MDTARCTLDGNKYSAVNFAKLPPDELIRKKDHLICLDKNCGARAFFRKASKSGQAACFGARPHKEGCGLAARNSEQTDNGLGDDQDRLVNPGNRIILDLNSGKAEPYRHNDPNEDANASGRGGRFNGEGSRPNAVTHRNLKGILRELITSEEFGKSLQTIEIPGLGDFRVCDFFVPFRAVTEKHCNKKPQGCWGKIASVGVYSADESLWLNSGDYSSVSVRVPEEFIAELFRRLAINDKAALAGAHMLALGELRITDNSNKKYVRLTNLAYIAVDLP